MTIDGAKRILELNAQFIALQNELRLWGGWLDVSNWDNKVEEAKTYIDGYEDAKNDSRTSA